MAVESIYPQESPKDFSGTGGEKPKSVGSGRLLNIAALAVAGYIVITAIELGMRWAAITAGPLEPAFWAIGLIGSPIFAASEAFNLRPLERGSFVLRIAATVGVLVAALFIGEV